MSQSFWIPVKGNSMSPALIEGDEMLLEPASGTPAAGDVIVLRLAQGWTAHRVLRVERERLVTRGDACVREDPPAPPGAALYRVTARRRHGREQPVPPPRPSPFLWLAQTAHQWGFTRYPGSRLVARGRRWTEKRSSST